MNRNGQMAVTIDDPVIPGDLARTLHDLERRFGRGAIMRLDNAPHLQAQAISTGFPALDRALGIGGLPRGRIVDIYGPEGSGKTSLCLHVIAEAQQQGHFAVFIDAEHALDPGHACRCGVKVDRLYLAQPAAAEEALEIAAAMVQARAAVVVIDSAAALVPRAEVEGEMGDHHAGLAARLMSQALRKLAGPVRRNNCILIFTNQLRQDIAAVFGSPEKPTGGRALRCYASIRLDLRRVMPVKKGEEVIGARIRAVVKKNRVAPPFQVAEFELLYGPER